MKTTKIPCAKTVLSYIQDPNKKRRIDSEKMKKLLTLIESRLSPEKISPEKINARNIQAFLDSEDLSCIFDSNESDSNAAPAHFAGAPHLRTADPANQLSPEQEEFFRKIQKTEPMAVCSMAYFPLTPGSQFPLPAPHLSRHVIWKTFPNRL